MFWCFGLCTLKYFEDSFDISIVMNILLSNKNVDIKFIVHDAFLQ
jgi:hypothetical protein